MVFRTTSDKRARAGLSLVEATVTLGVAGIVLVALGSLYLFSTRSFVTLKNHLDLDSSSARAIDRVSLEIRQADRLVSFSTNRATFVRGARSFSFIYLPEERRLIRKDEDSVKVLLENCDALKFGFFQRTPQPGGQGFYPATRPDLCKVVQVTWELSRASGSSTPNASALRSAQVVIRNQQEL